MQGVTATPGFVSTIQAIANDPAKTLKEFPVITPSQKKNYSLNYETLAVGIATTLVSLVVFEESKPAAAGFFSIGAFCFYHSVDSESVETDEVIAQRGRINDKFNSCIQGLKAEQRKKNQVIYDTLNDKPIDKMEGVKLAIEEVAAVYDGVKDSGTYTLAKARELDQASYKILRESSKTLMDFNIEAFPNLNAISTLALEKMKMLCAAAKLFYVGDDTGTKSSGKDAYVGYGCYDNKAIISPVDYKD